MKKLLLIDDQKPIRSLFTAIFGHDSRFEIETASDGEEGLDKIQRIKPDLILLDVKLPGMSGLELCRRLKEDPNTSCLRIFLLTADAQASDLEEAAKARADDVITKPFRVANLKYRIERALEMN